MSRRPQQTAERAGRTSVAVGERPARAVTPERDLTNRIIREDEWLDPGLARRRGAPEGER